MTTMTRALAEPETVEKTEVEEMQDEAMNTVEVEGASVEAEGLQAELASMADAMDVSGFKCVQCGLSHMHDTNKHRASDSFDITSAEAAEMDYNPACHCGYNALAAGVEDHDIADDISQASSSAPIPDETMQEIKEQSGGL